MGVLRAVWEAQPSSLSSIDAVGRVVAYGGRPMISTSLAKRIGGAPFQLDVLTVRREAPRP
jgi:hypothetical protein